MTENCNCSSTPLTDSEVARNFMQVKVDGKIITVVDAQFARQLETQMYSIEKDTRDECRASMRAAVEFYDSFNPY